MHKINADDFKDDGIIIPRGPKIKIRKRMGNNLVEKPFKSKKDYKRKKKFSKDGDDLNE